MRPGQAERRAHDCLRHGATGLFAALDTKTGKGIRRCGAAPLSRRWNATSGCSEQGSGH